MQCDAIVVSLECARRKRTAYLGRLPNSARLLRSPCVPASETASFQNLWRLYFAKLVTFVKGGMQADAREFDTIL